MNRFVKTYAQGAVNVTEIWVDVVTGVDYMYHSTGSAGGLTPLIDADGKPVITQFDEIKDCNDKPKCHY